MNEASNTTNGDRYPGRWFFRQDQSDIFFGRETEKEELFHMVRQSQVVVLFAKSGIGKSSLLYAGVSPLLLQAGYQPITILFTKTKGADDQPQTPLEIFKKQLSNYFTGQEFLTAKDNPRLWEYFKTCQFEGGKIPVLVFDQFEELFGYPPEQVMDLLKEFSEIIHDRPPSRVIQWILNIETSSRTSEQMAWATQPVVKFIFAIRSDRLSEMQVVNEIIPAIFNNRYQLLPIDEQNAKDAIKKPAEIEDGNRFGSPSFSYDDNTVKSIIGSLKGEHSHEIELSQLQIICSHIENKVKKAAGTANPIKKVDKNIFDAEKETDLVLQNNYESQLSQVGNKEEVMKCRKLLEDQLLEGRTRVRLPKGVVMKQIITEVLLGNLLATKLIKMEVDLNGAVYYEITHDSLVDPILNSKSQRELEENKEKEKQKELAQAEETRQKDLAEAEQCRRDHYKPLGENDFEQAIKLLQNASTIYDRYDVLKDRVETRLLMVKILLSSDREEEAKKLLDDTFNLADEKHDRNLVGRVNEDLAAFFEGNNDNHAAYNYYKAALNIYRSNSDSPQIARLAEHLGGFKELLYDTLLVKNNNGEKPELVIAESFNFYTEALKSYSVIRDIFGTTRVHRSLDRVRRFTEPWGYLTQLFTAATYPMKGKGAIRIGRDVYDEITKTYVVKNEIGFSGKFSFMSRRHASISPDYVIEDMQSTNGTTINTLPLYYGNPRVLRDGDIIVLANIMPLQFTMEKPSQPEIPKDCWGALIIGASKTVFYLTGEQVYSVTLLSTADPAIYDIGIDAGENDNAVIKFKLMNGTPLFQTYEKMAVFPLQTQEGPKNIMGEWKIRTTIKDQNRFYKDYILNSGEWFGIIDFPLQPQLTYTETKSTGGETNTTTEEETILVYGPTFQLILKPEFNKDLKGF